MLRLQSAPFRRPFPLVTIENGLYIIRGPRQVGKTSWLKTLLRRYPIPGRAFYLSCENMRDHQELATLLKSLRGHRELVLLDEISFMGVSKNECIPFIFWHSRAHSGLKRRISRLFVRASAHEGEEVRSKKYFRRENCCSWSQRRPGFCRLSRDKFNRHGGYFNKSLEIESQSLHQRLKLTPEIDSVCSLDIGLYSISLQ